MLFGCPLPDELDPASIGQRTVSKAFEAILSSVATKPSESLIEVIRDAHKQQSNHIKLVKYHLICLHAMFTHVTVAQSALQLESLWDASQENGGHEVVDFLATAPSCSLLVVSLHTCLL